MQEGKDAQEGEEGSFGRQLFPFRAVIMLIHLALALGFTYISKLLNKRGTFRVDVFVTYHEFGGCHGGQLSA